METGRDHRRGDHTAPIQLMTKANIGNISVWNAPKQRPHTVPEAVEGQEELNPPDLLTAGLEGPHNNRFPLPVAPASGSATGDAPAAGT